MLTIFRYLSLLEGTSLLAIISVTLGIIPRDFVAIIGMTHGVLFLSYLGFSLFIVSKMQWHIMVWVLFLAAGFLPFGFIPVEVYIKNILDTQKQRDAEPSDDHE